MSNFHIKGAQTFDRFSFCNGFELFLFYFWIQRCKNHNVYNSLKQKLQEFVRNQTFMTKYATSLIRFRSYIYEKQIWTLSRSFKWYMRLFPGSELLLQDADFPLTPRIRSAWDCEEEAPTWLHQVGSTTTWCSRIAGSSSVSGGF